MTELRKEFAETTFAPAQNVFTNNVAKPLIKLSTFDGKTGWSVYRTQLEIVANANGWDDATSAIHLAASLRREAADILQTLPAEKRNSLQDLLKALELRFGDSALRDYHKLQLKIRSQKNAESLQELAADIERLSLTAYPDSPPNVRDPETQQAMQIADHKDLKSALIHAMKVESAQQASKKPKYIRETIIKDSAPERRTENNDKLDTVMDVLKNRQSSIRRMNI